MIVRAPDLAFCDFCCQPGEVLPPYERGNLARFRCTVDVIEIEYDRVGLTAVNAWMSQ